MAKQFLSDTLTKYIARSGYSIGQVARLSGVPRRSLANWATGRAKRPRNVDDLLKIAATVRLNAEEVDELLISAEMGTTLAQLLQTTSEGDHLQPLLEPWANAQITQTPSPAAPLPTQKTVPFQAIRELPYFVGRTGDLEILAGRLQQSRSNLVVIQGMGGVGKSSVAARLAYQLRDEFPDGVLWARVDQSNTMAILHSFAAAFGRDVSQYSDPQTRSRVVREILADKRVLMVLDDAHDDDEIELLLPPTTKRCGVIVTTRRIDLSSLLGAFWYKLSPFGDDASDSLNLFAQILGEVRVLAQRAVFEQLAARLGNLPLAIAIMAGRLATDVMTSAESLLEQLSQQDAHVSELTYGRDSLTRSFDLSYEWLTADEQHFFATLGLFANDDLSTDAIAHVTETTLSVAKQTLQKLFQLSLVLPAGNGHFKLHPLLHDYANTRLDSPSSGRQRMIDFFVTYCASNQFEYPKVAAVLSQIQQALAYAEQDHLDSQLTAGIHAVAPYLIASGQFDLAESYLERAQQIALLSMNDQDRARAFAKQGEISLKRGDVDRAGKILGQALRLVMRMPEGRTHTDVYRCLGLQQMMSGEIDAASESFNKGLQMARAAGDHDQACLILSRLSELERTRGDYDRCEIYEEEGLSFARALRSNRLISLMLNSSGITSIMRGDYEKGEACFRESLKLAQAMGDKEKSCGYLMNLATLSMTRGRLREAHDMHLQALEIAREIGHRVIQSSLLMNIAVVCWRLGWLDQAGDYLEEGYTITTVMQFTTTKLAAMRRMGDLYTSSGHFDKAERIVSEGLALARRLGYSAEMTRLICTTSDLHLAQRDLASATNFAKEGLRHAKELGLPVEACQLLINLAEIALQQNELAQTSRLLDEATDMADTIDDAVLLCRLRLTKAKLAMVNREYESARALCDGALQLSEQQSLCYFHAASLFGKAQVLVETGELARGEALGRKSLALFEQAGFVAAAQVRDWLYSNQHAFVLSASSHPHPLPKQRRKVV